MADRPAVPTSKFLYLKGRTEEEGGFHIEEIEYHVAGGHPPPKGRAPLRRLLPLQPPLPCLRPPPYDSNDPVKWTWVEGSRVYHVDFSEVEVVSEKQLGFLGLLMERDELTVIFKGGLPANFKCNYQLALKGGFKSNDSYGKFQRFGRKKDANGKVQYKKYPGAWRMLVSDFLKYAHAIESGGGGENLSFKVKDAKGNEEMIESSAFDSNVFYMTDIDMQQHMGDVKAAFEREFKLKEILPCRSWCMMHGVENELVPDMGPNCFISPGGGYTQMHQDGHGTVDSVHVCLQGYNEVVILRRLPEKHKQQACRSVPHGDGKDISAATRAYNMMYNTPNALDRKDEPLWATNDGIQKWEADGFCPAVITLGPGDVLLIRAGCMHAFRKATPDELPTDDCHYALRKKLEREIRDAPLCVSVAWDWHFLGVTAPGINRHCAAAVEAAMLCRDNHARPLGIPEVAILMTAAQLANANANDQVSTDLCRPDQSDIAAGIMATLEYIVMKECAAPKASDVNDLEDTSHDEEKKGSYTCITCEQPITNTYYECHGCDSMDREYFVCVPCYTNERHTEIRTMAKIEVEHISPTTHHVGKLSKTCNCPQNPKSKSNKGSSCKNSDKGSTCEMCTSHTVFTKRFRFFMPDELQEILKSVKAKAAGNNAVGFGHETYCRLQRRVLVQGPDEAEHPGYGNYGSYGERLFPAPTTTTTTVNDTGAAEAAAESSQTISRRRTNGDGHLVTVQQLADPAAARPVPSSAAPAAVTREQGGNGGDGTHVTPGYCEKFPFRNRAGECVLWELWVPTITTTTFQGRITTSKTTEYRFKPPKPEGRGAPPIRTMNALQRHVCKETPEPDAFELLGHTFRFQAVRQGAGAELMPPFPYQGSVASPSDFVEFIKPLQQWASDNGWNQTA